MTAFVCLNIIRDIKKNFRKIHVSGKMEQKNMFVGFRNALFYFLGPAFLVSFQIRVFYDKCFYVLERCPLIISGPSPCCQVGCAAALCYSGHHAVRGNTALNFTLAPSLSAWSGFTGDDLTLLGSDSTCVMRRIQNRKLSKKFYISSAKCHKLK